MFQKSRKILFLAPALWTLSAVTITAFVPLEVPSSRQHRETLSRRLLLLPAGASDNVHDICDQGDLNQRFVDNDIDSVSSPHPTRRQAFKMGGALALASGLLDSQPAWSADSRSTAQEVTTTTKAVNLNGLLDLPPVPTDYCRIFLCRHGQTENNRLRLVQGSRVDIPINDLGRQQGQRAGMALARAGPSPSLIYHSPLIRARQTAQEAIREGNLLSSSAQTTSFRELKSIMEVDFGNIAEGKLVEEAKPGMAATYARWALGQVDYRPDGGGDSGRDVIARAVEAVDTLTQAAASDECPNRCVAAFTHSTYLRILLAVFLGDSLVQDANMRTDNGGINVIDVNLSGKTKTLGPKSKLVGGLFSQAPKDFVFKIPVASVVRVNEIRHLEGLI